MLSGSGFGGGQVCGVCRGGLVMVNTQCVECDAGLSWFGRALYALAALLLLAAYSTLIIRPLLRARAPEATRSATMRERVLGWVGFKKDDMFLLQRYLKVTITFLQLLSSFLANFTVSWSRGNVEAMSYASVASFDLFALPGPSCVTADISYEARLVLNTTLPLLVLALLVVPAALFAAFSPHRHQPVDEAGNRTRRSQALNEALAHALTWLFIIYPMVCGACLKNFICQPLADGLRLLKADYSIECPVDEPGGLLFGWSVAFGTLYVIGIPAAFYFALQAYNVPKLARCPSCPLPLPCRTLECEVG